LCLYEKEQNIAENKNKKKEHRTIYRENKNTKRWAVYFRKVVLMCFQEKYNRKVWECLLQKYIV